MGEINNFKDLVDGIKEKTDIAEVIGELVSSPPRVLRKVIPIETDFDINKLDLKKS